jgi:hypothetical protein
MDGVKRDCQWQESLRVEAVLLTYVGLSHRPTSITDTTYVFSTICLDARHALETAIIPTLAAITTYGRFWE